MKNFFAGIFQNLNVPVAVCGASRELPLIYVNPSATLLASPVANDRGFRGMAGAENFDDLFRFKNPDGYESFIKMLSEGWSISDYPSHIVTFEDETLPVSLMAERARLGEDEYIVIYIHETSQMELLSLRDINNVMSAVFSAAYHTGSADDAINSILKIMGEYTLVDRAYIFEELSPTTTGNTYEWCAPGVEPAIDGLRVLAKEDYPYDMIISNNMYVANDIMDLPEGDRAVLEPQGIKAIAIMSLFHSDKAIGYVGFDDCRSTRIWTTSEVQLLKYIANILVSLIVRRDAERQVRLSHDIMQTISDNINSIIYVSALDTYEVMFANKAVENSIGLPASEIIGRKCYEVMQKGQTGPCSFCPIPKLVDKQGKVIRDGITWEQQNTVTGKWYLARDTIIKWTDGRDVHFETATEITRQKEYEQQLEHYASIDIMTGALNREWGYKLMSDMIEESAVTRSHVSLCFIDLDGLKIVNDTQGHDKGDEMILNMVKAVRSCIRETDAIVRWGGDEFLLLLRCNEDAARRVIGHIEKAVDEINREQGLSYTLSFSYGVTALTAAENMHSNLDAIVSKADKLMYENKMSKRQKKCD